MEIYDEAIIERSNNLRFRVDDVSALRAAATDSALRASCQKLGDADHCPIRQTDETLQLPDFAGLPVYVGSGDNALCGDTLTVAVAIEQAPAGPAVVRDVRYAGYGCALCLASADVLAEQVRGMEAGAAARLDVEDLKRMWGGLTVGRARVDCVALSVRALKAALANRFDEGGGSGEDGESGR